MPEQTQAQIAYATGSQTIEVARRVPLRLRGVRVYICPDDSVLVEGMHGTGNDEEVIQIVGTLQPHPQTGTYPACLPHTPRNAARRGRKAGGTGG